MSKIAESSFVDEKGHVLLYFHCPGCNTTHTLNSTWEYNGDPNNPTIRPSILVTWNHIDEQFRCHSYITDGNIEYMKDSTHSLAGKTVPLPEFTLTL